MNKIVVAVNGSNASKAAVQWVAANAPQDAEVIAVGAMSEAGEFALSLPGVATASSDDVRSAFRQHWCAPLDDADVHVTAVFEERTPAAALTDAIRTCDPDLVVVGKPAHVGIELVVHGPLQHALHDARCPVLVVPEPAQPPTSRPDDVVPRGIAIPTPFDAP